MRLAGGDREDLQAALAEKRNWRGSALFQHSESQAALPLEISLSLIRTQSAETSFQWLVALREVPARSETMARLNQLERLHATRRMAKSLSRQLSALSTGIFERLMLAQESLGEAESAAAPHLRAANDLAREISMLAQRLQLFCQDYPIERRRLDAATLLERLRAALLDSLDSSISLTIEYEPGLWPVCGDQSLLLQGLLFLASNARAAMPEGGSLGVRAENCEISRAESREWLHGAEGRYVRIVVSDTGRGMDRSMLRKAFEPFATTKNTPGAGMGLAMVYGIVRHHQGFIGLKSLLELGTEVSVFLPAAADEESERARGPEDGD